MDGAPVTITVTPTPRPARATATTTGRRLARASTDEYLRQIAQTIERLESRVAAQIGAVATRVEAVAKESKETSTKVQ